jgi:hypothetical protein
METFFSQRFLGVRAVILGVANDSHGAQRVI